MEYSEEHEKAFQSIYVNLNQNNKNKYIYKLHPLKENKMYSHSISSYEIEAKEQYEASLRIKKFQLIRSVLVQRDLASKKISSVFRAFHTKISFKRTLLTYQIIRQREAKVTLIQSTVRKFLVQKDIKGIGLTRGIYIFFYIPPKMYYTESQCGDIPKISFQLKNGKRFDLNYSKALRTYYIPLKKTGKREYHLNFIVNDHNIVDSRFPVELNPKNGSFYNIISSSMMYKPRSSKAETNKRKWEQIFQIKKYYQKRKISIDTTVSQNTDVSAELSAILNSNIKESIKEKRTKPHKSILRKWNQVGNNISKKRVTFCTRCEYVIY